ncbi:hypothetical protein [Brachybacterium sp.]|uniref:hypothetical protein n=1 Tax=Brachybacterium sp. TaxID=1891286 RepID=UPI002ED47C45
MNRYITRGILEDLTAGRSVLVVSPSLTQAKHAHAQLLDHAYTVSGGDPTGYRWSFFNGGQWLRDERTKIAATFTSIRAGMVDHAQADVVVIDGYRQMIGDGRDVTTIDRISAITRDRETVVID